jgi:hypothetical protein
MFNSADGCRGRGVTELRVNSESEAGAPTGPAQPGRRLHESTAGPRAGGPRRSRLRPKLARAPAPGPGRPSAGCHGCGGLPPGPGPARPGHSRSKSSQDSLSRGVTVIQVTALARAASPICQSRCRGHISMSLREAHCRAGQALAHATVTVPVGLGLRLRCVP